MYLVNKKQKSFGTLSNSIQMNSHKQREKGGKGGATQKESINGIEGR